jgi:ATP/ADP translocase
MAATVQTSNLGPAAGGYGTIPVPAAAGQSGMILAPTIAVPVSYAEHYATQHHLEYDLKTIMAAFSLSGTIVVNSMELMNNITDTHDIIMYLGYVTLSKKDRASKDRPL